MNGKKIFQAMRNIDPRLVLDAAPAEKAKTSYVWVKWGALAACLGLVVGVLLGFWYRGAFRHTHVFGEWETVKDASCTEQGEEVRLCSCGEAESRFTAILPHFAGEWVVEKEPTIKLPTPDDPNEREPGLKAQFCERCGAKLDEEIIPATGSLGLAYAMNADCKTFSVAGIGNCTDTEIIIPENFCGYHVTSIMEGAFKECDNIKSVTLPETVSVIGKEAFFGCNILLTVELFEGLVEIGDRAFASCTTLENITIPSTVQKIGEGAFRACYRIKEIVIPNGVTVLEKDLFNGCWSLSKITLPEGLLSIGEYALKECAMQTIEIPKTVQSIGKYAFFECEKLRSIDIPEGITVIESYTFSYCTRLAIAKFPSSLTKIGSCSFQKSGLEQVVVPAGVTSIGDYAFEECNKLKSVVLPEGLQSIGVYAFCDCVELTGVKIPASIKRLGAHAFAGCEKLIQVENGVHYVDKWVVKCEKNVTEVVLREDTVGIADSACQVANALKRITLPNGLKYIGEYALYSGYTLEEIIYDGTRLEWENVQKEYRWCSDPINLVFFARRTED